MDESGVDRRTGARRTGWAPSGVRPARSSVLDRHLRYQILPALCLDGLLEVSIYEGSTNAEGFMFWLERMLLPRMNPYPGPKSVLVMDNASWHYHQLLADICVQRGVRVIYLPPYSPDFNPIEAFFGDLKQLLRREFNQYEATAVSNVFFRQFLMQCAMEISSRCEQIRNHFRHCHIMFPDEGQASGAGDSVDDGGATEGSGEGFSEASDEGSDEGADEWSRMMRLI